MHRPGRASHEKVGVERGVGHAEPQAFRKARADVAHLVEFGPEPAFLQPVGIACRLMPGLHVLEGFENRLCRGHAGFHRGMRALDLRHIQEAGGTADKTATREGELRDRLEPAFVQRARAIGHAAATFEHVTHGGVCLEALEFLERREMRIAVVETDDIADGNLVAVQVIQEGTAICVGGQRPADRMPGRAGLRFGRIDIPQLLDADGEGLRVLALAKVEPVEQRLGQMAAAPFCKDGLLGAKLHAAHVHVSLLAILADAHVTGRDTAYGAGLVIKHLGGSKARINLDAERFGLLTEPAAEIAERDNVVAVIVHLRRCRQAERPALGQEHELVGGDRRVEGRAALLPVRDQLVQGTWFEHGARQDVRANLAAFFNQAHFEVAPGLGGKLLQPDRSRQARRAAANDHDIEFHCFTFHLAPSPGR